MGQKLKSAGRGTERDSREIFASVKKINRSVWHGASSSPYLELRRDVWNGSSPLGTITSIRMKAASKGGKGRKKKHMDL